MDRDAQKLVVVTQDMENYGEPDNPYWKYKCGSRYVVILHGFYIDYENPMDSIIDKISDEIAKTLPDNDMFREYVIEVGIEALTKPGEFEQSQMEYDGRVAYWDELFVASRNFITGEVNVRKATRDEVLIYRSQLLFAMEA